MGTDRKQELRLTGVHQVGTFYAESSFQWLLRLNFFAALKERGEWKHRNVDSGQMANTEQEGEVV